MGCKKGHTNNPNGRPKGSKNKVQNATRERVTEFIIDDFDNFINEIITLPHEARVKYKMKLLELVTPKPLNNEESDKNIAETELYERLFRDNSK